MLPLASTPNSRASSRATPFVSEPAFDVRLSPLLQDQEEGSGAEFPNEQLWDQTGLLLDAVAEQEEVSN